MENIPEALRHARRNLSEISGYECIEDWQWDSKEKVFYLHFSIDLSRFSECIQAHTEWYLTATANYPSGQIHVYPSASNGIVATFSHQSCNAFIVSNGLWRSGDLCLASISASLDQGAFDKAPTDISTRLYWHIERTIRWLYAAVDGTLTGTADLFESPDFSAHRAGEYRAVYNEDAVSLMNWSNENEMEWRVGTVDYICEKKGGIFYLIPKQYLSSDKKFCFSPPWETAYQKSNANPHEKGLWILLKHIPVLNIWQAPITLVELCDCCKADGIDLREEIINFSSLCRDGYQHPVSIGFPIPQKLNGPAKEITWKTFLLPTLSYKHSHSHKLGAPNGFQFNERGWSFNDKMNILVDKMELQWMPSENWNRSAISSRGHLTEKMQYQNILLIGCGSLGSSIAEILARSAAYRITCLDPETLLAGNLCRHTLTAAALSCPKASALAAHIKDINPCIDVRSSYKSIELSESGAPSVDLSSYDIIIDSTGEDSVLETLETTYYKTQKTFVSCSVGLGAEHLYFGAIKSHQPDFSSFRSLVAPYCVNDISTYDVMDLPRDGIGCWHPLFPARSDDMWLAASTAIKTLERFVNNPLMSHLTVIYGQKYENDIFEGYQSIEVHSV
ncbi:ThiF family adenylyltransferase [Pygmaiobacter massiliensis]|uniref:ThiF family adenylyltransferase n=1 Tax=Pygmaiobacter massiliensis TaxID=1917873 RepID=UPI002A83D00F|nr:ThiF family adenylyltransferase [Pygmaiobacter massiliensis]MDY4784376.1 ThiF family adenylyltransferase [Pygmaiobacter massiliensis]